MVDVAGGLLAPGFVDGHVHTVQGGLERIHCDLSEQSTEQEYLARIGSYAAEHPGEEWILGGGWAMPAFPAGARRRRPWTGSSRTVRSSSRTGITTARG